MKIKLSSESAINYIKQIFESIYDKPYYSVHYKDDYLDRKHFFNLMKKSKNPEKELKLFIQEFIKTDGLNIKGIPLEFITDELKSIAILNNENSITYIHNPTEKDYLLAINNGFSSLKDIKLINKKIMMAYAKKYSRHLSKDDWASIPEKYKNDLDIINELLKNGVIEYLDKKTITQDMVIKSLFHNIVYLSHCPDHLKNKEVIDSYFNFAEKEVSDDFGYSCFQSIPSKFLTKDRILKIVKNNGYNLNYLKASSIDYEICQEAIKSNSVGALKSIPDTFFDKQLIDLYIEYGKKRGGWFRTLVEEKKHFLTLSICKESILENGLNLEYVPEKMQTTELCELAINNDIKSIEYVKNPSMEIYLKAVSKDLRLRKKSPIYQEFENDQDCLKQIHNYKKTQFLLKTL